MVVLYYNTIVHCSDTIEFTDNYKKYFLRRNYALRRVKDGFRDSRGETDPQKVEVLLEKAEQNLNMMKRQVSL